jgi:hypothetical protein
MRERVARQATCLPTASATHLLPRCEHHRTWRRSIEWLIVEIIGITRRAGQTEFDLPSQRFDAGEVSEMRNGLSRRRLDMAGAPAV